MADRPQGADRARVNLATQQDAHSSGLVARHWLSHIAALREPETHHRVLSGADRKNISIHRHEMRAGRSVILRFTSI